MYLHYGNVATMPFKQSFFFFLFIMIKFRHDFCHSVNVANNCDFIQQNMSVSCRAFICRPSSHFIYLLLLWITVNCATLCVHQKRLLFVYRTDSLVVSASDCVLCNCRFKVRHGKWWIFIWRRKWKICRKMYKNSFLGTVLKFHLASYRFILHARGAIFEMLIAYQHACCPWTLATMTRPSLTEGMPAPI